MIARIRRRAARLARRSLRPSHAGVVLGDWIGRSQPARANAVHVRAAIEWLCRAQDAAGGGGVSAAYLLDEGWAPPYPETTGYIVPTFLAYARRSGEPAFAARARRMGDWEIEIQMPDGAVRGGSGIRDYPIVFNTGQVILGWNALYRESSEARYLDAAVRAADWLLRVQDRDGKWSRHVHAGVPHAYHTRVAWPLLELAALTGSESYRDAGRRNVAWALSNARPNGFVAHMGFTPHEEPLTHTIAYTLRGLLESAAHLPDLRPRILELVRTASDGILERQRPHEPGPAGRPRPLPGTLGPDWRSTATFSCITGNVQLAIVWLELHASTGHEPYRRAAANLIEHAKTCQRLGSGNGGLRGALPGSSPIWGAYQRWVFPNWAPKFFADAVLRLESAAAATAPASRAEAVG